jgi:hypothetical protein
MDIGSCLHGAKERQNRGERHEMKQYRSAREAKTLKFFTTQPFVSKGLEGEGETKYQTPAARCKANRPP